MVMEHNDCCGGDPCCQKPTTVEGDMVHDECQEMINLISDIRMLVGGNNEVLLRDCCLSLTVQAGKLVQAVIEYVEPDAGMGQF